MKNSLEYLFVAAVLLLSGCKEDGLWTPGPVSAVLRISSVDQEVSTKDIKVDFSVELSRAATDALRFSVAMETENPDAVRLETTTLEIAKEKEKAGGSVTLRAEAFDWDTDFLVTLRMASPDEVVVSESDSYASFRAYRKPVTAQLAADASVYAVPAEGCEVPFRVVLSEAVPEDIVFGLTVAGTPEGAVSSGQSELAVAGGETVGSGKFSFDGSLFSEKVESVSALLALTTEDTRIRLSGGSLRLQGVPAAAGVVAALEAESEGTAEVGASGLSVGFTVAVAEPQAFDLVFTVTASGAPTESFTLSDPVLVIRKGQKEAKGKVFFEGKYFDSEEKEAAVTLAVSSEDASMAGDGTVTIRAVGKQKTE